MFVRAEQNSPVLESIKIDCNEESNKNEIGERAKLFYSYVDVNLLQKDGLRPLV